MPRTEQSGWNDFEPGVFLKQEVLACSKHSVGVDPSDGCLWGDCYPPSLKALAVDLKGNLEEIAECWRSRGGKGCWCAVLGTA